MCCLGVEVRIGDWFDSLNHIYVLNASGVWIAKINIRWFVIWEELVPIACYPLDG